MEEDIMAANAILGPTPKSADTEAEPAAAQECWDLGPWENGYRQIWTPSGTPFQAGVVAHVFGGDLRRERLIVAAPDLLAVAKWARSCVPYPSDCHAAIVAAIAKAEGR